VVLEVNGGVEALGCGGESERLVFDHVPANLADRPTLSTLVEVPSAGRYEVRLSYLAVRIAWSADYIARVDPDGRTLHLTGWITLSNQGDTGFADAPTSVVAGELARVPPDLPEPTPHSVEPACWPQGTTHGGWAQYGVPPPPPPPPPPLNVPSPAPPMMARAMVGEIIVTAQKRVVQSELGDYKLYTLAEPTTVAAQQTKQIQFLDKAAAPFETVYSAESYVDQFGVSSYDRTESTQVVMRLKNKASEGLGDPLPAGAVQIRQIQPSLARRELLVGEAKVSRDVPVGEPFELDVGEAADVTFRTRLVSSEQAHSGHGAQRRAYEIVIANAKATTATVEFRHRRAGADFRVVSESDAHQLKAGDPLWRLVLPAGEAHILAYAVTFDSR
jgi:hypothetical protein